MGDVTERSSHYYETDRNRSSDDTINLDQVATGNISEATESDYNDFWENAYTFNLETNSTNEDKIVLSDYKKDNMPSWGDSGLEANIPNRPEPPKNDNGFWKYHEDVVLKEVREYLGGTYRSHYASSESKTQTLDLIEGIGDAEPFCRSNAIKYLSRFGKKNGKNRLDLLKAIHYCILLYHFAGLCNENSTPYETF